MAGGIPRRGGCTHLLTPYASGNAEVMAPMSLSVRLMAGSATRAGAEYVRVPLVKYRPMYLRRGGVKKAIMHAYALPGVLARVAGTGSGAVCAVCPCVQARQVGGPRCLSCFAIAFALM